MFPLNQVKEVEQNLKVLRAAMDDPVRVIARLDSQLKSKVLVLILMGQKNTLSQDTRQI